MKCKNKNCNEEAEWCDKCMNLISKENKQLKKLRNSALRQVEEMQDAQVEIVNKFQEENRQLKEEIETDETDEIIVKAHRDYEMIVRDYFIKELKRISEKLDQYKCGKHKLLRDYIKERIDVLMEMKNE